MTTPDNVVRIDRRAGPDDEAVPLAERGDDELMLLARGGVNPAFDELVRRHQGRVLRVAARYLGDPVAARDAAQSAFIELYRYLPRYRPQGKLRALLHRLALNQCRMQWRRRGSAARARESLVREPVAAPSLPEEQILARERRREVERALGRLSTKLREVLLLRFSAEMAYQEIADTLDLPLGTVKSRISAGLTRLQAELEGAR